MQETVLELKNYSVSFDTPDGEVQAVRNVDLTVKKGEILCIVGESGCGKTVMCRSVMKLLPPNAHVKSGEISLCGENITAYKRKKMEKLCGSKVSMVFQDPMLTLNPTIPVGKQITEAIIKNQKVSRDEARKKAVEMLKLVGIPDAEQRYGLQPHFFSGGMRQRVMIAMALACEPKLLIADEPTTALDVTIQAQILHLMNNLKEEHGTAIMFITHDLGVINQMADDVAVMYCGQVVEHVPARVLFAKNTKHSHPYTEGLLASVPRLDTKTDRLDAIPGAVPHPLDLPKGCKFAPRCKYCTKRCMEEEPELVKVGENQEVRCFYPEKEARHAK